MDDLAFLSFRLTFGGSPCPFLWCPVAEAVTDLANNILSCKEWDQLKVHIPHTNIIPRAKYLPASIQFAKALPPDVNVPPITHSKVDGYIDNLIPGCSISNAHRRQTSIEL